MIMCGIVGYIGNRDTQSVLLEGLKKLEYRGYDSAGIAVFTSEGLKIAKSLGRLANLESSWRMHRSRVRPGLVTPVGLRTANRLT